MTTRTFLNHQKKFLQPAIKKVWTKNRNNIVQKLKETNKHKELVLGGDGRCGSPGHCAKYGVVCSISAE
ncbi:hypothetical protein NQZ68_029810 [Dissostichus eleginoides]|nr:hypothetical protein NQZ68_029810 [Dissostichus eleginoides]